MPLVTTTCNQCEQGRHTNCPAEIRFINNSGDHCACAATKHENIPQNDKESPKIKSMLGRQKEERDVPVAKKISVEEEVELERD